MPPTSTKPTGAPLYGDTSFLFSLYMHDVNTAAAGAFLKDHPVPLAFSTWQACELRNAVRLAVARRTCTAGGAKVALEQISADVRAGNLVDTPLVWPDVLQLAESLSEKHTMALAVRTLDLLHVAAAIAIGARVFVTFDGRQTSLAQSAGLQVRPG